jgi:hypothetical protein
MGQIHGFTPASGFVAGNPNRGGDSRQMPEAEKRGFLWRYRALSDVRAFPLLAALHGGSHPEKRGPHHSNIISLIEFSIGLTPCECDAAGLLPGTGLVFSPAPTGHRAGTDLILLYRLKLILLANFMQIKRVENYY